MASWPLASVSVAEVHREVLQPPGPHRVVVAIAEVAQRLLHEPREFEVAAAPPASSEVSGDRSRGDRVELAVDVGRQEPPRPTVGTRAHQRRKPGEQCETSREWFGRAPGFPLAMNSSVGEPAATADERFSRFVLPEVDVLLRVARTLTPNQADAEDLVQDTLIRAYQAIDRFDGAYPRAWLLTILRNTQINRTRRRRPELLDDPDRTMATVADTSPDGQSVEALVVDATFDAIVEDAFRSLPDDFRYAVELVDLSGLTYAEAAEVMGVPVGTIMSRIHRARRRMRDRLATAGIAPRSHR